MLARGWIAASVILSASGLFTSVYAATSRTMSSNESAYDNAEAPSTKLRSSVDQLAKIREQVMILENSLVTQIKANSQAKANIQKLQTLIQLQRQERAIGQKRMQELESTVRELEVRRETLNEKVERQKKSVQKFLIAIESSTRSSMPNGSSLNLETEANEEPRRKLLANLTSRSLKELEVLKADLSDADHLESRIQEEKAQLANLFQDLNERESVLELNRQLQVDLLRKNHAERVAQLENYNKLKASQAQVETLIGEFNARKELEKAVETERVANREMYRGEFAKLKGQLGLPVVGGKILTAFGRGFDEKSKLYIFKKGIDIQASKSQPVQAIFPGKVAYSGELPEYGRVAIIDHGHQFYSLCAHLGELNKKPGDAVAAGDAIGLTDETGVVYFEIRARNVPVNPLQWLADSFSLKR
jgi:septal ring factor EnvC (AmiA/AmiB activator)